MGDMLEGKELLNKTKLIRKTWKDERDLSGTVGVDRRIILNSV
jgi:hypothetical protein